MKAPSVQKKNLLAGQSVPKQVVNHLQCWNNILETKLKDCDYLLLASLPKRFPQGLWMLLSIQTLLHKASIILKAINSWTLILCFHFSLMLLYHFPFPNLFHKQPLDQRSTIHTYWNMVLNYPSSTHSINIIYEDYIKLHFNVNKSVC